MRNIPHEKLRSFAQQALSVAGADFDSVKHTTAGLVDASLRGVDSHGIRLLPHYLEALRNGRLNKNPDISLEKTGLSTAILDADHGLGFAAGAVAIEEGINIAKDSGMAAITVKNSSHNGMLAYYTLMAAENNFFAIAMTNTTPRLIPPGGRKAFLGTNPISYAVPLGEKKSLCFDSATTMITGNKIKLHRTLDIPLPEGVATDRDGISTTDPHTAELLMPFGDYKGFGIALLIDILCGVFTGMPNSEFVTKMYDSDLSKNRELGQFYLIIDIKKFRPLQVFQTEVAEEIKRLRNTGKDVHAPGDKELMCGKIRREKGIPLSSEILDDLNKVANNLGTEEL